MSRKYKRLDDWKLELIGKIFTFLTVNDVVQIINNHNKKRYVACCSCKCGNECQIDVYGLINGHNKSCGCYETSPENSERHKKINENNKRLRSENRKQWCKDNPDKVKEIATKRSLYYKEHPDKAEEISIRCRQWCKNNPDKVKEIAEKNKQWYKNNPDKVAELNIKQQQWRSDKEKVEAAKEKRRQTLITHPEICKRLSAIRIAWCKNNSQKFNEAVNKQRQFYKDHPDKITELSNKTKLWIENNPDKFSTFQNTAYIKQEENRIHTDYSLLLNVIHPDYVDRLHQGKLTTCDIIKTKCPICGQYDEHTLGNVFIASREEFKSGNAPLCKMCMSNYSTSKYEKEIADFIKSFSNTKIINNDRSVLDGKELDIYIPEKKIAIEFNGDYWHDEDHKPKHYHCNKYLRCKENGILLISIFESDWNSNKATIKSYIKDAFNNTTNVLSYIKENYMNNNYPDVNNYALLSNNIVEDYYVFNNKKIYTCGYTKLE